MYAVSNACMVQTTLSLCNQNVTFPKHLFNFSDIYYAKRVTMYIYNVLFVLLMHSYFEEQNGT